MFRRHATVRVLCGLILCGLMTGCSDNASPTGPTGGPSGPSSPQVVDRTFTLGVNESGSVNDGALELRFKRVIKDERCPADAICVAGMVLEAVLEFDVIQRNDGFTQQSTTQLSTWTMKTLRTGGYNVSLEMLTPYPFASQPPIKPEDWRATVRITTAAD